MKKNIKLILGILLLGFNGFSQTPNWQLKCQYNFSQTFGSTNYYYDFDSANELKGAIINNGDMMKTTTDGGQTWSNDIFRPYSSCQSVKYIAPNKMLTTGYKKIFISLDNGQTHNQISSNYPNSSIYSIDAKNNFILMGGSGHYICYSTDGGQTFKDTTLANNAQTFYHAYILDSSFAYVVARAGVYYTTNRGPNLDQSVITPIPGDFHNFCVKDRLNWLIALQDNNSQQKLYKTNDGGMNWQEITSLLPNENSLPTSPKVKISSMFATPDGQVFIPISNKPALYSNDFCTSSLVYDSVDTNIDLSNSTEHQYKIINNKVYLLVKFSLSGTTTYRVYTTNFNNSNVSKETSLDNNFFQVYPNPNNGYFSVQTNKPVMFDLIDITGKTLQTFEVNSFNADIQVDLPAGLYFVREKETYTTQKLIIQK